MLTNSSHAPLEPEKVAYYQFVGILDAPGFLCERHRAVVANEDSYTIDCTLEANPAVDATSVVWAIGNTDLNLTSGQAMKGYNATSEVRFRRCRRFG